LEKIPNPSRFTCAFPVLLLLFPVSAQISSESNLAMFGRKRKTTTTGDGAEDVGDRNGSDRTLTNDFQPTKQQVKRATRTRLCWSLFASFCLVLAVVFVIVVEVGNTKVNKTLNSIYFIKLDLTNIVPTAVPNSVLINSIAQTLGLHDFYTVGLWGFCEGYNGQGTTQCSNPQTLYWFDPVSILQSELLAGASSEYPHGIYWVRVSILI